MNEYFRTDIDNEIIGNYELLNYSLENTQNGSQNHWKLSLLLTHVLLQNIFVKSLHSKNCFEYMKLKPRKDQPYPGQWHEDNYSDKILDFKDLYKKVKKQNNIDIGYDKTLFRMNDEIRNRFFHYDPKLIWSIEYNLMKQMIKTGLEIVNMLIENTNNIPMQAEVKEKLLGIVKKNKEINAKI